MITDFDLSDVPALPGVYLFLDSKDRILYVGKAKALKNRLASYFNATQKSIKTERMLEQAVSFRFIVTANEVEAFLLEANLIKTERPRYNILLKDSKGYPYVKITHEVFPRASITRNTHDRNALYFGPFVNAGDLRGLMEELLDSFPLRSCSEHAFAAGKICLKYQMKRCMGPCEGLISKEEYRALVDEVKSFFKGDSAELKRILTEKMADASKNLRFEEAARIRDRLKSIEHLFTRQTVMSTEEKRSIDLFVYHTFKNVSGVTQLFLRGGKVIGASTEFFDVDEDPLATYIMQFYNTVRQFPDIIVPAGAGEQPEELAEAVSRLAGRKVQLRSRGFSPLVELALRNGEMQTELMIKRVGSSDDLFTRLTELSRSPHPVRRVECIDISHLSGEHTVGVSVVNEGGEFVKSDYRKYSIRSAANDDFTAIHELISRKMENVKEGSEKPADLYIIDGGIGQLNVALKAAEEKGANATFISISKGRSVKFMKHAGSESIEQIHIPNRKNPATFRRNDPLLLFIQSVRDETHRSAITYQRQLALKRVTNSPLLTIPGMGKKRLKALFVAIPDLYAVHSTLTPPVVAERAGIPESLAADVLEKLKGEAR